MQLMNLLHIHSRNKLSHYDYRALLNINYMLYNIRPAVIQSVQHQLCPIHAQVPVYAVLHDHRTLMPQLFKNRTSLYEFGHMPLNIVL